MSSNNKKFSFSSAALPDDTFDVVSFSGTEGLSKLYRFDVTLISENDEIDLESVIQSRATLTILRENGDITFNGILSGFEQMGTVLGRTHYRAVLTPAFWRQTLTHHNQIFLNKTIPEIIEATMKDGGLNSLDYDFRLTSQYLPHEYVCQYDESHHRFVSRLMEREGIYYYFEQGDGHEKVVITDTALLHTVMDEGMKMYYSPPSGLDESSREEVIKTVVCSQSILPARVLLKDYNYRKPSLDLTAECVVSERGLGDVYIYGEHFTTPEEGARLAKVRAEALKCRARVFQGESLIPYLRPGYIFELVGHNRKDFNNTYLTTDITHNGDQTFMFAAGLDEITSTRERSSYYRNSFTAITSGCQFRPERTTEKPRISGTLNAHIDAEGSGEYSEIDEQGRYKVVLPFDLNSVKGGKASSWLRMAQPYAGDTHGMHFPLHKGTEVLLTFIDGDPDRPIIAAAVPNPLTPSPVTTANATQSRITTAGGNKFHLEDQKGSEGMLLQTPKSDTSVRLGQVGDNSGQSTNQNLQNEIDSINSTLNNQTNKAATENTGLSIYTGAGVEITSGWANALVLGESTDVTIGTANDILLGSETSITAGSAMEIFLGKKMDLTVGDTVEYYSGDVCTICAENELTGQKSVLIKAGGASPAIAGPVVAILALTAVSTSLATTLGTASKLSVAKITAINESIMAISTLFCMLANSSVIKAAEKLTYASTIEMGLMEIETKSPQIKTTAAAGIINKTGGALSNTALAIVNKATATIKNEAPTITNTASTSITNTATTSITSTAATGDITCTATLGDIINTAATGSVTNNAAIVENTADAVLSNEGKLVIVNKGDVNKLQGKTSVEVSAAKVSIEGTATVTITANGVIKFG